MNTLMKSRQTLHGECPFTVSLRDQDFSSRTRTRTRTSFWSIRSPCGQGQGLTSLCLLRIAMCLGFHAVSRCSLYETKDPTKLYRRFVISTAASASNLIVPGNIRPSQDFFVGEPRRRRRQGRDSDGVEGRVWRGDVPSPVNSGGLGEHGKLSQRGPGRSPSRKRVLVHLELERTNLIATDFIDFLYNICLCYTVKTVV